MKLAKGIEVNAFIPAKKSLALRDIFKQVASGLF